jgi:hypothetical protein
MKRFSPVRNLLAIVISASMMGGLTVSAQSVDIEFENVIGSPTGTIDDLGSYYSSSVIKFTDVATSGGTAVDLRVTASAWGTHSFVGHLPDYSESRGEPNGDLGLYYQANSYGSGGLSYTLEFFKSGTNFTTTQTISQFDLLIYDVDGESMQSEKFRAYLADGLTSYRLADSPNSVTASYFTEGVLFSGPGYNIDEEDATGAAIITFKNTNKITLDFESTTTSGPLPNGIFTAIDGDLSILKGDTCDFKPPVTVPEPSGMILVAAAGILFLTRRKRPATR